MIILIVATILLVGVMPIVVGVIVGNVEVSMYQNNKEASDERRDK